MIFKRIHSPDEHNWPLRNDRVQNGHDGVYWSVRCYWDVYTVTEACTGVYSVSVYWYTYMLSLIVLQPAKMEIIITEKK